MGKQRAVQVSSQRHENKQFPKEAPGFTADIDSLKDLSDAVHNRPDVPKDAKLVVETPNPAGGTWWQRWSDIENLPSEEVDPIKVKAVQQQQPSTKKQQPGGKKKGKKGAVTRMPGKKQQAPATPSPKNKREQAASPKKKAEKAADIATGADDDEDEDFDLVKAHLDSIAYTISDADAKIDKVESQMLDSYDNEKKVTVLARIQDRLAGNLQLLQEQRTAILVAAMAIEDDVSYEEYMAQHFSVDVDDDDDIDDFS